MRRPAKGGTTHPSAARPGYGYGRPLKPDPDRQVDGRPWLEPDWWLGAAEAIDLTGRAGTAGAVAERS
jgi:hypothetical protein